MEKLTAPEMGGYLPLELPNSGEYFRHISPRHILAVNTGRTAIRCAVESLHVSTLWVPAYYCPDIIAMLRTLDVALRFYRIGPDLMPVDVAPMEDAAIILVDYFGTVGEKLLRLANRFPKAILDFAHSFYTPPVIRSGIMNVYSCRKFFGVSDGAYVIGKDLEKPALEQDMSFSRAVHLLKSIELGTNGAYAENKANELALGEAALSMSALTHRILSGIDYADVERRRRENFAFLHETLQPLQGLTCLQPDSAAYMYPLLLPRDIHRALVSKRIYVPVLWSQLLEPEWNGTLEQTYSANIVPLPMDQRYSKDQLRYMADVIAEILNT